MLRDKITNGKPLRWVAGVLERSGDLVVLGGGMIGIAVIVGAILVGLHERGVSFRAMSSTDHTETVSHG